jgi:ribosomal protein S4E
LNNERSAITVNHESAATAIDGSATADSSSITDVESQSSHESTTAVDEDDDEPETFQEVSKSVEV